MVPNGPVLCLCYWCVYTVSRWEDPLPPVKLITYNSNAIEVIASQISLTRLFVSSCRFLCLDAGLCDLDYPHKGAVMWEALPCNDNVKAGPSVMMLKVAFGPSIDRQIKQNVSPVTKTMRKTARSKSGVGFGRDKFPQIQPPPPPPPHTHTHTHPHPHPKCLSSGSATSMIANNEPIK